LSNLAVVEGRRRGKVGYQAYPDIGWEFVSIQQQERILAVGKVESALNVVHTVVHLCVVTRCMMKLPTTPITRNNRIPSAAVSDLLLIPILHSLSLAFNRISRTL
jgi:hypothetical protein